MRHTAAAMNPLMPKSLVPQSLVALLLCLPLCTEAAQLQLRAKTLTIAGQTLHQARVDMQPQGAVRIAASALVQGKQAWAKDLGLACERLTLRQGQLDCRHGELALTWAQVPIKSTFSLSAVSRQRLAVTLVGRWQQQTLATSVQMDAAQLRIDAKAEQWPVAGLLALPPIAAKLPAGMTATGQVGAQLQVQLDGQSQRIVVDFGAQKLTASDASGRFASENLDAQAQLTLSRPARWLSAAPEQAVDGRWQLTIPSGQTFVDPLFLDFAEGALQAQSALRLNNGLLTLSAIEVQQPAGFAARGEAVVQLQPLALQHAALKLEDAQLPAFFNRYAVPFLAGKPGEDAKTSGSLSGSLNVADGRLQQAELILRKASLDTARLDLGLSDLDATLYWTAAGRAARTSKLSWGGARFGRLELPASRLALQLQGDALTLTETFRQPILNGAFRIDSLSVQGLGSNSPQAMMKAEVEPIDLEKLTATLGWPPFAGQLAGRLPGLTYQNHVLALDGALTAQAFDGDVSISNLRWVEPAARSRRLTADLSLRRIDLAKLTGAFSYGRIDGRIDGDVENLQLVGFTPTAFDARIYTSPKNPGKRRISQRAIDNISSLGGGPTGLLSRSVLRFFDSFAYSKLGISCRLRNGVCLMDGVEPARNGGYVIVKGSLVPRIDVVGHSRRVDWDTFYAQLLSLRDLQAPTTGVEVGQ